MRIRKRFLPSSLSSLPLSDPQLSRSLVVQPHIQVQPHLHLHHGNNLLQELKRNPNHSDPRDNQPLQQPATGQEMVIGTENPILVCPRNSSSTATTTQEQLKKQKEIEGKEIEDERWKTEEKKKISNDIRKENISSAEVLLDMQFPQSSFSSCQAIDRWGEGDKIVPPKKRKGSFERMGSKEMIKPKMKSKTNKKCLQQNGHHDVVLEDHEKKVSHKEGGGVHDTTKNSTSSTKKSKRGNVIMEGSRCSRVNGRGWRCCQQTLVGYSLCEHHLGKGRLRSMTSVRNRDMADQNNNMITTAAAAAHDQDHQIQNINETAAAAARLTQKQDQIITKSSSTNNLVNHVVAPPDELDERKPLMISRKKRMMKIGAVKARSISSLLGQTDSPGAGAANRNKNSSTSK